MNKKLDKDIYVLIYLSEDECHIIGYCHDEHRAVSFANAFGEATGSSILVLPLFADLFIGGDKNV